MTKSKRDEFTADEMQVADTAKALSHPARIKILKMLAEKETCICGEIVESLPLAQATVSQHLKELKRVGLIQGEIEGPRICYCLDPVFISKSFESFKNLFQDICKEGCLPCKTKTRSKR